MLILADEMCCFHFSSMGIYLYEPVAADLVFTDTPGMTDEQVAVTAAEEFSELIIRQTGLYGHNGKLPAIEFLNTVWKADPAKIVLIVGYITNGALQQAFIYTIAEGIKTFNILALRYATLGKQNQRQYDFIISQDSRSCYPCFKLRNPL